MWEGGSDLYGRVRLRAVMDRLSDLRRIGVPTAEVARPIDAGDVPRESIEVVALGVQRSDAVASGGETDSLAPADSTAAAPVPAEMERFFTKLGEAKAQLAGLRRQLDGLDELLRKFKAEFNPQAQGQVGVRIEAAIAALNPDLSKCQRNLQSMQDKLDSAETQLPSDYSGSDLRAQKNLLARLRQDAASLVEKFMKLQKAHETWHHATVKRQVEIVGGALTDEEKAAVTEDYLERGVSVFKEEVDGVLRKKQAEIHLQVEAQHAGAVQVERNIAELAKLFESFSLLVHAQGESIDRVEAHVRRTETALLRAIEVIQSESACGPKVAYRNAVARCQGVFRGRCGRTRVGGQREKQKTEEDVSRIQPRRCLHSSHNGRSMTLHLACVFPSQVLCVLGIGAGGRSDGCPDNDRLASVTAAA